LCDAALCCVAAQGRAPRPRNIAEGEIMHTNSRIPGAPVAQALPAWAMPLAAVATVLAAALLLPPEAVFVVALAAAIGLGVTVAEWRRAPDAPVLGLSYDD
jgi:hypothetical protein